MKNSQGNKIKEDYILEQQWKEMLYLIRDGIIRKLDSAKKHTSIDIEISAGLYIFAYEEFGKILLLENSKRVKNNTKRKLIYANEFANHEEKFKAAFDYLENNQYEDCNLLKGGFSKDFAGNFDHALLADLEARLSIFYCDFEYDTKHNIVIQKPPKIDSKKLDKAIDGLSAAVSHYPLP